MAKTDKPNSKEKDKQTSTRVRAKATATARSRTKAKAKAKGQKKKLTVRIAGWFRGMKSELKKVVWPTRKQVTNSSLIVLVIIVVAAILLWAFDYVASSLVHILISLFG